MEEVLKDAARLLQDGEPEQALLLLNEVEEPTLGCEQLKSACKRMLSQQYLYLLREAQKERDLETANKIAEKHKYYIGEDERITQLLDETKSKHESQMAELVIAERQKEEETRLIKKAERKEHLKKFVLANIIPIEIGIVSLSLLFGIFVFRVPYLELKRDLQILHDGISEREEVNNRWIANIQAKSKELTKLEKTFLESANKLEGKTPLIITDIKIGAADDEPNNMITEFGSPLYSENLNLTYLIPQITYYGLIDKNVKLTVRWYGMDGQLIPNWPFSKDSRYYTSNVVCKKNKEGIVILDEWGSNGWSWSSGTYRIEIWLKDLCLKKQYITIY